MSEHAVVGQNLRKVDGVKLVTGGAAFTDDIHLPGMLIGKILPSPHAHARIRRIDTAKARALPGVHAVLTYRDVPRVPHTTAGQAWPEPSPYDTYLLDSKVRFVGDRVAAVAAESRAIAERALKLIEVDYDVLPAVLDMEQAMAPGAAVIHDEPDSTKIYDRERNIAGYILREIGNVEEGFRAADYILEREFRTQRQQHAMLEPHVSIAWLDADGRLVIRSSTQVPYHCRRQVAMILQLPVSRVHVIKPRIGGGFGGKQEMLLEDITGALALAARRPVKIEYTREEEFYMARSRHPQILRMKMGARRDGTVTASQLTVLATTGAYGSHSTTVQGNTGSKVLPLYRTANMRFECHVVYTNMPVAGAFRGYGCPQGFFAQETVVDEIAAELGIDPLEFHRRNVIRLGDVDRLSAQLGEGKEGLPRVVRSCGLPVCMERAAEAIGWAEKRTSLLSSGRRVGRGCGRRYRALADRRRNARRHSGQNRDHVGRYRHYAVRCGRLRFEHHHHLGRSSEEGRRESACAGIASSGEDVGRTGGTVGVRQQRSLYYRRGTQIRQHDRRRTAGHVQREDADYGWRVALQHG
jgi:putative selenate reductase molybdopterin-binding subunit